MREASSGERGNNEQQCSQQYGGFMRALYRGKEECSVLVRAERWGSSAHRGGTIEGGGPQN